MPKKASSNKTRKWERDRREKLNETFNLLSTLLPSYDPTVTRSKIEILQKAAAYISDLQKENRELIKNGKEQTLKQVRVLKLRIENLLRRIQQLARLLQDAGISIPPELPKDGLPTLKGPVPKWSNKLRQEDAPVLLEKITNKKRNIKKERTILNQSGSKKYNNEEKVITVSSASSIKVISTTSKTKPVNKNKKKISNKGAKKYTTVEESCNEFSTVSQLLGLSLNDIDIAPPLIPPGSGDVSSKNLPVVTSNAPGTNVTVLASSIPQVPQGFIVIPKASSTPATSKSQLPQSSCFVMAPATQTASGNQNLQPPCVVMSSKTSKVLKASLPIQQPVPIVLSSTTSALESIAIQAAQKSDVAVTNSHLLTAPIMATGIQACPAPTVLPQGTSLSGLGPGTLILANGSILPIFPSPQPVSSAPRLMKTGNNTQIVMDTDSSIPTSVLPSQPVLLVQNKTHTTSDAINTSNVKPHRTYSLCLPKPLKRKPLDPTKCALANKVPISALKSRNHVLAHSSIISAPVVANKKGNKLEIVKNGRRVSDKKITGIQKGVGRGSKSSSKMNNKNILVNKGEIKNTLEPCEGAIKNTKREISKITSIDSSAKENVNKVPPINRNNTNEVQMNNSELHEVLISTKSIEQNCDEEENLTIVDSQNKRKRLSSEDDITHKKVKCGLEVDKSVTPGIHPIEPHPSICTSANSTGAHDTPAHFSVNEDGEKTKKDCSKMFGDMDSYSVSKNFEKNDYMDVNKDNAVCTLRAQLDKTKVNEVSTPQNDSPSQDTCLMSSEKAQISCSVKDKISSSLSYNIPLPTSSILLSKSGDTLINKQFLNSSNDPASSAVSENCEKTSVVNQSEESVEKKQDLYTISCVNKTVVRDTLTDFQSVSVDAKTCDVTTVANATSRTLEKKSTTCDVYQQKIEKNYPVTSYAHPASLDVQLIPQKQKQDSGSENICPDASNLETNFTSQHKNKTIQEQIPEQTLLNVSTEISNETNHIHKDSADDHNILSDKCTRTNQMIEEDSCKTGHKSNKYNESPKSIKPQDQEKTEKHDYVGKACVTSEISSSAEYNTFSSVPENNASACASTNKMFRSTETLDLGTSTNSSLCLTLQNNDLSNDLFASLHVPPGAQHAESISPTAAFLLAFPLVSTSKVSDIIGDSQDDVGSDSLQGTSTLLQIGNLDSDQSGAIISRSPTYHNSNSTSKVLPQSPVTQKQPNSTSESSHQELECQHFLPPESSNKIDQNIQKIKIDHVKFPTSHDNLCETDKIRNKNWMSLHNSPQSDTINKLDNETNIHRNLNNESYASESHESQLQGRETIRECSKEKIVEPNCTFNVSKEISNTECSSGNTNGQSSQPANSNLPSFTVSQFVSSIYEHTPKEHTPVSTKQDNALQMPASTLQINKPKSINFAQQTSRKNDDNFMPAYKSPVINTSNTVSSVSENTSFSLSKDVMEQGTMTDIIRLSHPVSQQTSNPIKQSNTLSFSSNDCSVYSVSSQSGYMLSNSSENEKCNTSSFSIAHNSSNFNILSWSTLSPTSTVTNANQYDGFCGQNPPELPVSQNDCTSVPKKQIKGICATGESTAMNSSANVSETCPQPMKHSQQVNTLDSHAINKISSFSSSTLQNPNNQSLENQALIQQYLTEQRKIQNSIVTSNNSTLTSHVSQLCSGSKVPDNEQQHRPPVNWMTTPDTRIGHQSVATSTNSVGNRTRSSNSSSGSAVLTNVVTSKNVQFCTASNTEIMCGSCTSTTLPSFDTRTYTSNSFYGSHSVSSHNSQGNYYQNHSQPGQRLTIGPNYNNSNKLPLSSSLNRITDVHMGQPPVNDTYTVPWLQKKSNASSGCSSELSKSNFVSSSLPTLIGDLALGMNYSMSVNDEEHGNKESQSINFNVSNNEKKNMCVSGNPHEELQGKQVQISAKNSDQSKDQNAVRNSIQEFRNISSQSSTGSFLSVSQLVDQAHSCGNSSRAQGATRLNSITHQIGLPNKQNVCQPRSRQISDLSSTSRESKELASSLNASDKLISSKTRQDDHSCVDFRSSESNISITRSGTEGSGKLQSNQMSGSNNNDYIQEISNTVTSLSHISTNFPVSSSTQSSSTILANNVSWPSDVTKHSTVKVGASNCKAPASSYSAEALIGLNSSQVADRCPVTSQDPRGNKIFTLPPPVVSERFCRHQNFPPPPPPPPPSSSSRSLQVPPPFSTDAILPSNYFAPVELQSRHQDSSTSGQQTANSSQNNMTLHSHQNQQGFNTFTSSAAPSSVRVSAGQCNGVLYTHSDFMSGVGTAHSGHALPPVSLSCNFLSDLGTNNSYTAGILPDSANHFLFPSSTIPITRGSSVCSNSGSVKQNLTHLHGSTQPGVSISGGHEDSNQVLPSLTLGDRETYPTNSLRCNNGSSISHRAVSSETNLLQHNTVMGGSVCNSSKQRSKKRASESVTPSSVSGIGGLMDLGYLGMPPVIASPMLAEDGAFINHSSGFLTSGSQHTSSLYSGAPAPSQGSFYSTSHSQGQSCASLTGSHSGHLTVNSGSFATQTTRGLQLNTMVSPSTVSSTGTSLTNFNLSTIFPEINEKQVPNHAFNSSGPKDPGPLLGSVLPTSAPPPAHPQLNNSPSSHTRQSATLLLPPVSSYAHRQTAEETSICLPPPPPVPPVPLHSNFNNVLNTTAPQMCQWR